MKGGFALSLMFFTLFGAYAYAFYVGSWWVQKEFWNNTYGRPYTSGDVITCFFGILFGMFSIGMAAPNIQAVAEGRAAGKMAFDVIDRQPSILMDDPKAKKLDKLEGAIEFKNVSFSYPSRPD